MSESVAECHSRVLRGRQARVGGVGVGMQGAHVPAASPHTILTPALAGGGES